MIFDKASENAYLRRVARRRPDLIEEARSLAGELFGLRLCLDSALWWGEMEEVPAMRAMIEEAQRKLVALVNKASGPKSTGRIAQGAEAEDLRREQAAGKAEPLSAQQKGNK